jgi:glycosyltransferase involved in cell wall biosynthesis
VIDPIVAVVIPCFKVRDHILGVIQAIGPEVSRIYIVDDMCPQGTGAYVEDGAVDSRVKVIYNDINLGVGGAVMVGYRCALADSVDIVIKIDGDGQMDPALIKNFILPIVNNQADYTKGNRFYDLEGVICMPRLRIFGNACLSFFTKFSSGYYQLFDPTNGYTAIHKNILKFLPLEKISKRYFFESDMLFRLYLLRAVVLDIPMDACYADEVSNLKVRKVLFEFLFKNISNLFKRIFYTYYLRNISIASIELPIGAILFLFGIVFGGWHWYDSSQNNISTPVGTIMISMLAITIGFQLLLSFISMDMSNEPRNVMQNILATRRPYEKKKK